MLCFKIKMLNISFFRSRCEILFYIFLLQLCILFISTYWLSSPYIVFPTSQSGDIKELFVKQSWFTLTFNSIHPDMRSCFVMACPSFGCPSWCIFLNMVLIWFPVCIRRDHHHGPAGPWTEVRVHPDSQSRGWRGGPSAKDWHRYGNQLCSHHSPDPTAVRKK